MPFQANQGLKPSWRLKSEEKMQHSELAINKSSKAT